MKLKIKVKNIIFLTVISLLIILIIVPFATLEIAKYLDKKGSDKASMFYESYLSKAIRPSESEALYKYAINMIGDLEPYYIMSNFGGGMSNTTNIETMNKAILYLEDILSNTNGSINKEVYKTLLDASLAILNQDKLMDWISWGKNQDGDIRYISDIYQSYYYFTNEEYEMANNILNDYENKDVDYMYYLMKAYIAEFTGDIELAKSYYRENIGWIREGIVFGGPAYYDRQSFLEGYEDVLAGESKIRGKVTYNGRPMPFVQVYANESLNTFRNASMNFVAITDINGEYETLGLRDGKYNFGIGINNSVLFNKVFKKRANQILELEGDLVYDFEFTDPIKIITPKNNELVVEDKFTVEWEGIGEAEYYIVELTKIIENGNFRHAIPDENNSIYIYDVKATFDINYLRNFSSGTSHGGEDMVISPSSILSNFSPGSESLISVTAYDKEGNELGSSLAMNLFYDELTSIRIPGELSEGEKIILNGDHEKAIAHYENILQKDPQNLEALRYIIRYNIMGWKLDIRDFDKALIYSNDYLIATKDNFFVMQTLGYMDYPTLVENENIIKTILDDIPEGKRHTDYYWTKAKLYSALGDFKNARNNYEKIEEDFKDVSILEIDLYLGDIDKAIERLEGEDFTARMMSKRIVLESISKFDEKVLESKDYKSLQLLLENVITRKMSNNEIEDLYYKIYPTITNPYIKNFLDEYKVENYWNMNNQNAYSN